jgi:D-3-phosphoglycerate dehydrogenase
LLGQSDFVVPLAVATSETTNLIDGHAIARMKPTAFLVNASRGDLVDEAALAKALEARTIAGAALDVGRAPRQKPPDHLARRSDVIATPHIGGVTPPALRHQAMETVRQVEILLSGQIPRGGINLESATRLQRLRREW